MGNILNTDILTHINKYMENPYTKLKKQAFKEWKDNNTIVWKLENYNTNITKIYDHFVNYSMRKIEKINYSITHSRDADQNDESRESLNDIYDYMETITDLNLMKFKPNNGIKQYDIQNHITHKFETLNIN